MLVSPAPQPQVETPRLYGRKFECPDAITISDPEPLVLKITARLAVEAVSSGEATMEQAILRRHGCLCTARLACAANLAIRR